MARLIQLARGVVVLDAGGVLALAGGRSGPRRVLQRADEEGFAVILPTPVLAQVSRGGPDQAEINRVVNQADLVLPTSEVIARLAGSLMAAAGTTDAVDAIVVAEALSRVPSVIVTSDVADMRTLLSTQADGARVATISV